MPCGLNNLEMGNDMHPSLVHRNYLSSPSRYPHAFRRSEETGGGLLRRWLRAAVRRWKRRKLIAALEAMDDKLLRDIGVFRGDIRSIVEGFDDRELNMVPLAPSADRRGRATADSNWRSNAYL